MPRYLSYLLTFSFIMINAFTSYSFYHVNSFKLVMALSFLGLLLPAFYYQYPKRSFRYSTFSAVLFTFSPILLTLPGLIYSGGKTNYNFSYELAAFSMLACWMMLVREIFKDQEHLDIWFKGLLLLTIGTFIHSLFQASQLNWQPQHIKSTFGNRNYFAGYLIQVFTVFFSLAIFSKKEKRFGVAPWIYWTGALVSALAILVIRSRAGMGGAAFAGGSIFMIHYFFRLEKNKRKTFLINSFIFSLIFLCSYLAFFLFGSNTEDFRLFNVVTFEGWYDRLNAYHAGIESIKQSPLIGWGLGSSYNLYFLFVDPASRLVLKSRSYNHVHSEPMELMQEGGILSFITFLFFWGFIFYQGLKFIKKEDKEGPRFALMLGLLGAFLAYNLQSLVSVAPRMLVVRLPLYINLGLFFSLITFDPLRKENTKNSIVAGIVPIFFLLLSCFLYIPWAQKQNDHSKLVSMRHGPDKVTTYQKLLKSNDVYTNAYLIGIMLKLGFVKETKQAIANTQRLIPHYQNTDFTEGFIHYREGRIAIAKKKWETMQRLDRYHPNTNKLMLSLAFSQKDYQAFKEQFSILTMRMTRRSLLLTRKLASLSKMSVSQEESSLRVEEFNGAFHFIWGEAFIRSLYQYLQKMTADPRPAAQKIEESYQWIVNTINKSSFFKMHFKKDSPKKDFAHTQTLIREYFIIKNRQEGNPPPRGRELTKMKLRAKKISGELNQYIDWNRFNVKIDYSRLISKHLVLNLVGKPKFK